ncbi:sugar ABC transporter permease [Synergistales bacterium]|nr:sugar ABC transporter permease [Synergistales bacterium]
MSRNGLRKREPPTDTAFLLTITICMFMAMYILAVIFLGDKGFSKPQTFFNLLNEYAALIVLSCGLSVVMISGGIDISVGGVTALICMTCVVYLEDAGGGSTIAIAGCVIMRVLCGTETQVYELHNLVIVAVVLGCLAGMLAGAFNGILVSVFRIQPMVATLILFTAGRSIGSMVLGGNKPMVHVDAFSYWGNFIPGIPIPTPIFFALAGVIVIFLVLKFTNLALYAQSVGINENASRLNGLNPRSVKMMTYIIMGVCVGIAAFLQVSRQSSINPITITKNIEMDAILAVALGGNALSGGKFSMAGSVIGAYTIQALSTTLSTHNVPSEGVPAYKAIIIILIVIVQAPVVKEFFGKFWGNLTKKSSGTIRKVA